MKTFKHKKTGEIATYKDGVFKQGRFCVEIGTEPNSEFWVEVVKEDYEVLSYYAKNISGKGDYYIDPTYIWYETYKGNGKWSRQGHITKPYTTEEISSHSNYGIHSVKRLNDGEVFTIGDELAEGTILRFYLSEFNDGIYTDVKKVCNDNIHSYIGLPLNRWVKSNKPLFISEDGVDIFKEDEIHLVDYKFSLQSYYLASESTLQLFSDRKIFSTKKAAENYIICNRPCLSFNDVWNISNNKSSDNHYVIIDKRKLKELVKSKL